MTPTTPATITADESLEALRMERDAIHLYDGLAAREKDPGRAEVMRTIAEDERRHAAVWERHLRDAGHEVPRAGGPGARVRFTLAVAGLLGTKAVADLVRAMEGNEERRYARGAPPAEASHAPAAAGHAPDVMAAMAADERRHAEVWRQIRQESSVDAGAAVVDDAARRGRVAAGVAEITKAENWHRGGAGTLRAIVFGASDGLVSNLSLIMGIAGATSEPSIILLSGIAGLLAGAFSMAAGEYISVRSQVEVLERQIALERAELEAIPEEEFEELVAIYRSKGLPDEDARRFAEHIFQDKEVALQTLVREELGLDKDGMSSPWSAAGGSFVAFCIGAVIPVIPFLFGGGDMVLITSFVASLVGLFVLGALVSLLSGRNMVFSGMRQVLIGAAAAVVTYLVGSLIGVNVAG